MPESLAAATTQAVAAHGLTTEVLRTWDQLAALRDQWDLLLEGSAQDNVFLSWDWVEAWWRTFGSDGELRTAVAWRGKELVGIAPLYRCRAGRRVLRWIGSGASVSPDHLAFILRRGQEAAAVQALLSALLSEGAVLDLTDVRQDDVLLRMLARGADGICWAAHGWAVCPYARLPDSWQTYEARLSRKTRYNLRRQERRLMRERGGELVAWHSEAECETGLREVARLHRLRWQGRADRFAFSDAGYVAFHREFARRAARRGWLRLYGLKVDDEVIAAWYGFCRGEVLYHYQGGFDPAWEAYSPGSVLQGLVVREALDAGVKELDLLKGDHEYKALWATDARRTVRVLVARAGLRGYAAVAGARIESCKQRVRALAASLARRRDSHGHQQEK